MSEIELKAVLETREIARKFLGIARNNLTREQANNSSLVESAAAIDAMIAFAKRQSTPEPARNPCRLDAAVIERARIEAWAQATAWHRHGIAWKHLEKASQDDLIEAARMSLDVINFREGG